MCNNPLLFRLGTREKERESVQEGAVETILIATDRLFASTGDATEMVHQARVLGQATAQLIQAIKVMALMQRETGVGGPVQALNYSRGKIFLSETARPALGTHPASYSVVLGFFPWVKGVGP